MNNVLVIFLLGLLVAFLVYTLIWGIFREKELLSPWSLYLSFSIVDVFIPAIIYLSDSDFSLSTYWAAYIPRFAPDEYLKTSVVFTVSLVLFYLGYIALITSFRRGLFSLPKPEIIRDKYFPAMSRLYLVLLLSGAICMLALFMEVQSYGSLAACLDYRFRREYGTKMLYDSSFETVVFFLAPIMRSVFVMLVGVAYYYRNTRSSARFSGRMLLLVGLFIISTSFTRGSMLLFFVMLIVLENLRLMELESLTERKRMMKVFAKQLVRVLAIGCVALVTFTVYGAIRNFYSSATQGGYMSAQESVAFEAQRLFHGEGLIGLTWIMQSFPDTAEYLNGKTIIDMLLLPVPRSIYPSKPLWYGIADITRTIGAPETTQDAVTIPGELYANFGLGGIMLVGIFGVLFGGFYLCKYYPRMKFVYAANLSPLVMTSYWMAFTGFMNAMVAVPMMYIVLLYVIRPAYPKSLDPSYGRRA